MTRRRVRKNQKPVDGGGDTANAEAGEAPEVATVNATHHGILSRHMVLNWEDAAEYEALRETLIADYQPSGLTELHLVEELTSTMWRYRRLRLAEAAAYQSGLSDSLTDTHTVIGIGMQVSALGITALAPVSDELQLPSDLVRQAARLSSQEAEKSLSAVEARITAIEISLDMINSDPSSYDAVYNSLDEETKNLWDDKFLDFEDYTDVDSEEWTEDYIAYILGKMYQWIYYQVLQDLRKIKVTFENHEIIKQQAIGSAFDPAALEKLARYEVQLDRKFERTLSMLVKLQEIRRNREAGQ